MKIKLLLLIILMSSLNVFSQSPDLWQGDSIYRVNNIKTRTTFFNWDKTSWRAVDRYNRQGQLYQHDEFDTSGLKYIYKTRSGYDSITHMLNSQVSYIYGHYDTTAKQLIFFQKPDTLNAKFEYDSLKRIIKKSFVNNSGKIKSEYNYSYNPFVTIEKSYYDDRGWSETTVYNDEHFKEKKVIFINHPVKGDSFVITYTFKNVYDKSGKIIKRTIKADPESESDNIRFAKTQEYRYMSCGLLVGKTSYLKNKPGYIIMELFDYTFW